MLARIDTTRAKDPASEAARYHDVRAPEASHRERRGVAPQETARRRAQMQKWGAIVAQRHDQLRQQRS